jgi:DNA-binding NtrC family response regulator
MRRILLVDDEAKVLSALQRALRGILPPGTEIETCLDPEQALLRCADAGFDVVVSDYRMPGLTGADFLQMLKGIQPDTVRVVLSASNDIGEVMNAINRAEVYRYVAKPWSAQELERVFAQAFERRDELLEARRRAGPDPRLSPQELEARRLEAEEPGITQVRRDGDGSVFLDE